MNKTVRLVPVLLAVAALVASTAPVALGQEAAAATGPDRFNGTWRFAGSSSQGRQTIERAITRAVDGMNFITQPIASGRLRDKNPLVQRIEIQLTAANARVVFDGNRTYRGALNQWTDHRFDGDTIRVQFRQTSDSIVQMFRSDGGTRRNVYRLLPDGRLRLEVTLHADSLPRDLTYQLTYRR